MISKERLRKTISEIKEITEQELILTDASGKALAATITADERLMVEARQFAERKAAYQEAYGYQYFRIEPENGSVYILLMEGDAQLRTVGRLAASQIKTLILSYEEQFDRNHFMQNILLGNLLTVDVYAKAKRLHIEAAPRVVYVIDTGDKNTEIALEMVRNLADVRTKDFVTSVDEHSFVLIKDVSQIEERKRKTQLRMIADELVDHLQTEAMIKVRIGYGNVVGQLPELAQSFQEAKMALEVGQVFYAEWDTVSYARLGIGRLIYQLPVSLCRMYIHEVFGDTLPEILADEEAMSTLQQFFANNLNISETARQLYVHRNTLVYRLERIEKSLGLRITGFDDAMTFRIAWMVLAYMRNKGYEV